MVVAALSTQQASNLSTSQIAALSTDQLAALTTADVAASNGVIHVIDTVVLPN